MRRASSVQEAGTTSEARIHAISAANDLLISGWVESTSLRALVERTLTPFGVEGGQRSKLSGEHLQLPPRLVVAFALGLYELATNAAEYGAPSTAHGGD